MTTLADGTYELVPEENQGGISGAQVNPAGNSNVQVNQDGISKELNQSVTADLANSSQEGKPRSINLYFTSYAAHLYVYISVLVVHLSCRSWMKL